MRASLITIGKSMKLMSIQKVIKLNCSIPNLEHNPNISSLEPILLKKIASCNSTGACE
jgi:hypothetical protein